MTIRSGNQALQNQKLRRAHTIATTFRVQRPDRFVLRWTDHDRPLTVDGETYLPLGMGNVSAERREAGLREGNQEASGPIDGETLTIPDLIAGKYEGSTVVQSAVDWRRPWIWHRRSTKTIRSMNWDGSSWVATLEGIGAKLQQSVGTRFGANHSTACPHVLGDPRTCKADRTIGAQLGPTASGTVTSATLLTLTDSGASWTTNQFAGYGVLVTTGSARGERGIVVSNTATTLTLRLPIAIVPEIGSTFDVGLGIRVESVDDDQLMFVLDDADYDEAAWADDYFRDGEVEWTTGDNAGTISPVVGYDKDTRRITLLLPTPFPIAIGDHMLIRAGCDGLPGTCRDKFAPVPGTTTFGDGNIDNFGGTDYLSPGAGTALEAPT